MLVYIAFYVLLLFLSINIKTIKKTKYFIIVSLILFLILALRHPSMGRDLGYGLSNGYLGSFKEISKMSWNDLIKKNVYNYEVGYVLFNKLISYISINETFLIACCAFISIVPIIFVYYRFSHKYVFSTLLYISLPVFLILFSGLRQSIALSICFLSFSFVKKKKIIPFVLLVILAFFFHSSAICFLIVYPLYHIRLKNYRIISILVLIIIFILRNSFYTFFCKLFNYNVIIDNNGAYMFFLFFILIYIGCVVFEKEENKYLNIFFMACFCQIFSGLNSIAMRFGYYFMLFLPFLFDEMIHTISDGKIRLIIYQVVSLFFIIYGLYALYSTEFSRAVPYTPFWK